MADEFAYRANEWMRRIFVLEDSGDPKHPVKGRIDYGAKEDVEKEIAAALRSERAQGITEGLEKAARSIRLNCPACSGSGQEGAVDVDSLCLQHQVGAMAEGVDCIACFEAERHDATIDAYAVEAEHAETRSADLERRMEMARETLAICSIKNHDREGTTEETHDYLALCRLAGLKALAQLGAPSLPTVCPTCKGEGRVYVSSEHMGDFVRCHACSGTGKRDQPSIPILTTPDLPDGYPEWFRRVYGYASTQTRCIIALSRCTPNNFYYLVNAALRELNVEPECLAPVEGSWDWALAQMTAGNRVIRAELTESIGLDNDEFIRAEHDPLCDCFAISPEDVEATDWRIADGEKA